jgi:hypothetical protein
MAKRLVAATGQRLAALALLGALGACATTSAEPPREAQPDAWHIVERVGEARATRRAGPRHGYRRRLVRCSRTAAKSRPAAAVG